MPLLLAMPPQVHRCAEVRMHLAVDLDAWQQPFHTRSSFESKVEPHLAWPPWPTSSQLRAEEAPLTCKRATKKKSWTPFSQHHPRHILCSARPIERLGVNKRRGSTEGRRIPKACAEAEMGSSPRKNRSQGTVFLDC